MSSHDEQRHLAPAAKTRPDPARQSPHELEPEESHVLERIRQRRPISRDAADASDEQSSFGERLSDRVASVGGSWTFIICFSLTMLGWMLLNTDVLSHFGMAFDPYPYIFLNLMCRPWPPSRRRSS